MPLVLLGKNAYRGELGPVVESGIECTRLISLAVDPGELPVRAYVKFYSPTDENGKTSRGLVNEVAGYLCADAAGLSVPPRAGLIALDGSMISNPPTWLPVDVTAVGWWSEDVGHASLRASFNLDALPDGSKAKHDAVMAARDILLKHSGTPSIIALDDLIANIDRNLGNVLSGAGALTLIDHGRCITGPAWKPADLDPAATYLNKVRALLGAAADTLPYKSSIMAAYSTIVSKVSPELPQLRALMGVLLDAADASAAHRFIQDRASPPSVAHRIGVVA
jgi:hypothetical protein